MDTVTRKMPNTGFSLQIPFVYLNSVGVSQPCTLWPFISSSVICISASAKLPCRPFNQVSTSTAWFDPPAELMSNLKSENVLLTNVVFTLRRLFLHIFLACSAFATIKIALVKWHLLLYEGMGTSHTGSISLDDSESWHEKETIRNNLTTQSFSDTQEARCSIVIFLYPLFEEKPCVGVAFRLKNPTLVCDWLLRQRSRCGQPVNPTGNSLWPRPLELCNKCNNDARRLNPPRKNACLWMCGGRLLGNVGKRRMIHCFLRSLDL